MKRIFCFASIILMAINITYADILVRERVHTNSLYDAGTVFPADTMAREIWIGNMQMAYVTRGMIVIIDKNEKLLSILNRKAKTYVESSLPLDISNFISQDLFLKLQSFQISGIVKKSREVKKIGQKNCDLYEIIIEFPYPKEIKIWTTDDMPFDWTRVRELQSIIWKLHNYSAEFINMLDKIEGIWMSSNETAWMDGTEHKVEYNVIEIIEKKPPNDVYSIPDGYTKVGKLSLQDFRDLDIGIYTH